VLVGLTGLAQKCTRAHFDRFLRAVSEMLNSRTQSTASYSWYPDPSQVPALNPHSWASLSRLKLLPKVWRVVTNWGAEVEENAPVDEASASSMDGYNLAGGVQLEDSVYEDIDEIEASPDISPGKHTAR
jgi:hypothetical protein